MPWEVIFHDEFSEEIDELATDVKQELFARAELLEEFGPKLGRPSVDTLKDSAHDNMKELRFRVGDGVWRVAFAFDPQRRAVLLVAGEKQGTSQSRFYRSLIKKADVRYKGHLEQLKRSK